MQEVRAHTGHPWNELADSVATWSAISGQAIGKLPWAILHDLVIHPHLSRWEWLRHIPASFQPVFPTVHDGAVWQPISSETRLQIVTNPTPAVPAHDQIDFNIATYNALALNDQDQEVGAPGPRSIRLDQQFHSHGLGCICITSKESCSPISDNYVQKVSRSKTTV